RIAQHTVPDRTVSTVDPEARHIHKNRTRHQEGFKGHVAVEPETGLFTEVALRRGSGPENHEAKVAEDLLAQETEPVQVLGDSAYGTACLREHLEQAGHGQVLKPPPLRAAVPGGFTSDDFSIDTENSQVTCPAGHTVALGKPLKGGFRQAQFKKLCTGCPLRERCTTSKTGRVLQVHPQHQRLADARAQAADPAWKDTYRRWRPPVERGIAWLTAKANRRLRYLGTLKNDTWLRNRAAALNLRRLVNLGLEPAANGTWTLTPATP
ncbi:transposase, partial [Streptomyces kebangsaanensis]